MPKTPTAPVPTRPRQRKTAEIYQLKVTLLETDPPIWRRLLVPGDTTLARLDDVLQAAMGWTDAHTHLFTVELGGAVVRYGEPDPEWDFEVYNEHRPRLHHIARQVGARFVYEYDLGDAWEHLVEVEKILPPTDSFPAATCTGGERACPPEDAGGVHGYYEKLAALRDPRHEEHESTKTWMESAIGGPVDPDRFDIGATNATLLRLSWLKKVRR